MAAVKEAATRATLTPDKSELTIYDQVTSLPPRTRSVLGRLEEISRRLVWESPPESDKDTPAGDDLRSPLNRTHENLDGIDRILRDIEFKVGL